MKWTLGAFRESLKSRRVGEEAGELRPDMGTQRRGTNLTTERAAAPSGGGQRAASGSNPGSRSGSASGDSPRSSAGSSSSSAGRSLDVQTRSSTGTIYGLGRGRKVVVKARYRTHHPVRRGGQQRLLVAHVRYLARPAATQLARAEAFFNEHKEGLSAADVPRAWARDCYHWRIIVSPEDGHQLDMWQYVRDFARRLEDELDTPLEWVAVVHYNTDQPHAHVLLRGLRINGRDLVIPRHVVQDGLRQMAEDLATRALGERSQEEADVYLSRLAQARRATELDALLMRLASPGAAPNSPAAAWLDLQVPRSWPPALAGRHHLDARLRNLAAWGLAERTSPPLRRAKWRVRSDLMDRLQALATTDRAAEATAEATVDLAAPSVGELPAGLAGKDVASATGVQANSAAQPDQSAPLTQVVVHPMTRELSRETADAERVGYSAQVPRNSLRKRAQNLDRDSAGHEID